MTRTVRLIFPLGLVAAMLVACQGADGPTGLVAADSRLSRGAEGSAEHEDTVVTLKRLSPLTSRLVVSAVIGPAGGTISIPQAGGRVIFPAGALAAKTLITMTAKPGLDVAYDFQPHIVFPVPVTIEQDLRVTRAARHPSMIPSLAGAYFDGDLEHNYVDTPHIRARVKELRGGSVDRLRKVLSFSVTHFSGYLASSGRSVEPSDDR